MVARDIEHRDALSHKAGEHLVEKRHSLGGRYRSVIDIPRNHDGLHVLIHGQRDELFKHIALILRHVALTKQLAEMPVCCM